MEQAVFSWATGQEWFGIKSDPYMESRGHPEEIHRAEDQDKETE